jgi:hypothetical protein
MLRLLVIPQPAFYTIVTTRLRCSWDGDSIVLSRANSSRVFGIESFVLIIVAAAVVLPSLDRGGKCKKANRQRSRMGAAKAPN